MAAVTATRFAAQTRILEENETRVEPAKKKPVHVAIPILLSAVAPCIAGSLVYAGVTYKPALLLGAVCQLTASVAGTILFYCRNKSERSSSHSFTMNVERAVQEVLHQPIQEDTIDFFRNFGDQVTALDFGLQRRLAFGPSTQSTLRLLLQDSYSDSAEILIAQVPKLTFTIHELGFIYRDILRRIEQSEDDRHFTQFCTMYHAAATYERTGEDLVLSVLDACKKTTKIGLGYLISNEIFQALPNVDELTIAFEHHRTRLDFNYMPRSVKRLTIFGGNAFLDDMQREWLAASTPRIQIFIY